MTGWLFGLCHFRRVCAACEHTDHINPIGRAFLSLGIPKIAGFVRNFPKRKY